LNGVRIFTEFSGTAFFRNFLMGETMKKRLHELRQEAAPGKAVKSQIVFKRETDRLLQEES
jgi:hypothetical protein